MFFLDKKKKSSLNVLSEKDIQDKLYGRYRSNTGVLSDPSANVSPKGMEMPTVSPQPKAIAVPAAPAVSVTPSSASKEILMDAPPPSLTPAKPKDLFREFPAQTVREDETLGLDTMARFRKEVAFQKKKEETLLKRKPVTVKKKVQIDWSLVWKALGGGCVAVLQWAGAFLIGIFSGVNFRNQHFRKFISWLGAVGLLLLLFWGIHYLNANREAAMKMAKPSSAAPAALPEAEEITPAPPAEKKPADSQEQIAEVKEPAVRSEVEEAEALTGYGVQVVTYVSQEDAQGLVGRIRQSGFDAFVRTQQRSEGKVYYRVFLGPYSQYRRAQDELSRFKKAEISRPFQDAFVLSLERRGQTNG